ncbi:MAG: hypothetical protein ACOX0X_01530 [Candidatus Dojkabacteria bacterium]|jgi:hypothetical protein
MNMMDILFPKQCIVCSRIGFEICDHCLTEIPKALPTCIFCNRLSNQGVPHRECLEMDKDIVWIRGWNLSKKQRFLFDLKRKNSLFSIYIFLMDKLLEEKGLSKYNLTTSPLTSSHLDICISKKYNNNKKGEPLFLIGERVLNRKKLLSRLKEVQEKRINILTIF